MFFAEFVCSSTNCEIHEFVYESSDGFIDDTSLQAALPEVDILSIK